MKKQKKFNKFQSIFDLSYLGSIPNMTILAPKNGRELEAMLEFAISFGRPVALRFPRGTAYDGLQEHNETIVYGKSEVIAKGSKVALLAVGSMVKHGEKVRELLQEDGIDATLVNVRFVKPIDETLITQLSEEHDVVVTMEENVEHGGFGQNVASFICDRRLSVCHVNISIKDMFVEHGKVYELYHRMGLDPGSIREKILEALKK